METIEIKPTEIICLQTNDSLLELDSLRKCLNALLEYKNYAAKIYSDLNLVADEKHRFEYERIEQRFTEAVRGNEQTLQRYLQEEWTTATDEYGTTLQTFCDANMDGGDVAQTYTIQMPGNGTHMVAGGSNQSVDSLNSSYSLGEKKDVMAIAAAEVVMHSYRDGLYICGWPNCEYQTSSRRHINNHKIVHTGDGEFNCGFPECGRRFKTREELNEHAAMHNSDHPYPCVWPGCDFRSQTPATLKAHMRVHMERRFKCVAPDCPEEFPKMNELQQHRRTHDSQNGGITVATSSGQSQHPSQQQQQMIQQSSPVTQQPQQVTLVTQPGQPQQIAQIIATNSQGQAATSLQQSQITGQLQSGQQVTLIQLQQPPNANVGSHAIAHKTIVTQQQQQQQQQQQAGAQVAMNQPQPITTAIAVAGTNTMINTQLFKCNNHACNALFSTLYDLKQHMMQHSKVEKPFRCDYSGCEYSAYTKTALNEHKITHSNERNYVCPVDNCGRRYKTRKGLWDHSHTHRPDKPYSCTVPNCTYRCVSSSYLRSHMRAHKEPNSVASQQANSPSPAPSNSSGNNNGNSSSSNTVTIQQQSQPQPQQQQQSVTVVQQQPQVQQATVSAAPGQQQQFFAPGTIIQHPNGAQEFFCGIINCGKSFDNQMAYLNHVKTHAPTIVTGAAQTSAAQATAATPTSPRTPKKKKNRNPDHARFKCEFEGCSAAYKLKRNLKDHMIRHTILEKPYRCDWPGCDYGSYKSTNVAKHKSVHSDERKYGCDYYNCEKKFKTREGLRKHMLSHHKPSPGTATKLETP
ncbi:hypothetical protein TYRP_004291 [Tyrophagus putrescentiae]|nr:hypothetical protein TYRP_004291 [Tyrophagus putrescentiae]